ncbi:hypothetical protein KC349_g123 [Hortaea werneckii]|nr:hypothetical protein KC349_g123 [Hortaea werneckii]
MCREVLAFIVGTSPKSKLNVGTLASSDRSYCVVASLKSLFKERSPRLALISSRQTSPSRGIKVPISKIVGTYHYLTVSPPESFVKVVRCAEIPLICIVTSFVLIIVHVVDRAHSTAWSPQGLTLPTFVLPRCIALDELNENTRWVFLGGIGDVGMVWNWFCGTFAYGGNPVAASNIVMP